MPFRNKGTTMSTEAMAPNSTLPRPRTRDEAIVRAAAERIAAECAGWDRTSNAERWITALINARPSWDDGYRLARELETYSMVRPDSALVEILDNASMHLDDVHEEAERSWVRVVGFTPEFSVGDVVTFRHGTGPIHSIDGARARYVVDVDRCGNGGIYADAEEVTAAE